MEKLKNPNLILVTGGTAALIKKALKQWIILNAEHFTGQLAFGYGQDARGRHVLRPDRQLDSTQFLTLVNYLKYPHKIDYRVDVEGFLHEEDNGQGNGQALLVYIPEDDREHDFVYTVGPDNQTHKVDFRGRVQPVEGGRPWREPEVGPLKNETTLRSSREALRRGEEAQAMRAAGRRFRIIVLLVPLLAALNVLVIRWDAEHGRQTTLFLSVALFMWWASDFRVLRRSLHYWVSLLLAAVWAGYALWLGRQMPVDTYLAAVAMILPLLTLLLQGLLRMLFLQFLHREPVVKRPAPSFWDGFYAIVLFLLPILLSFRLAHAVEAALFA